MKSINRIVIWATCLFCCNILMAQTPVAYYPFNGNANDATGTLNGTVHGAALTTDRFGNANSAYSFDGVDDAISFAALPMTNTDNFTLMAWVNPALFDPANQFNKMIVSLGPGDNGYNMGMGNNSGSGGGNQLGGLYNLVSWLPSGAFFSTVNTWYHVAMVRENGITKFYLNGVLAPNTFNAGPKAFVTAFQIGGQDFDPTHYWNGKIDEVKIYNLALTADQVQVEYANNAQSPIPATALQLWLRGDDGITKDINNKISAWADQSSNNRTAVQPTVNKQPVWVSNIIKGHAVVRYDAVLEDILETNYQCPNSSGLTIFVVAQGSNISSPVRFQNKSISSTGFLIYGYTHFGASNGFCMTNDGGEFNGINCGFFANSQLHIGTARWNANTTNGMQTFLDGNLLAQRNSNNSVLPNDTLFIGTGNGSFGATDENTAGDIAEIIIYDRALTDVERLQVETYLNQKYRVTNNLAVSKPGSGNAISFDGSTQSVSIPNIAAINFGSGDFSLGFWYNSANNGKAEIVFEKRDDNCGDGQNWSIRKAADQIYLEVNVPGPTSDVVTIPNAADGKWHHIVFTRTATQLTGFKDGVLMATTNATAQNVNNSAPIQIATGPCSPFFPGGNGFFNGSLDEIQFWNAALTQTQIRDRMCKKITNADPLYSNLVAYYNFDESTGNIVFDGTFNANNGSLINNPTRLTSGAPIGNTSTYDYSGASSTAQLTHPTRGDIFASTLLAGEADGLQLYCVTEEPNTTNGQTVLSNNNSYFGVFAVNGTNEPFATVYHYNGIDLNGNPQNKLLLYQRADNAAATWLKTSAVLDSSTHTLSATSSSTEYMVGLNNTQAIFKPGSGNAIGFDGFSQSVSIPNSAASNFGSGNFSVEFWLNSSGTTRDEILMSKRDDGCGDGQLWGVYKVPSGTVYLELHNPGNINQRISVPNVLDGKWHHISFIRNGTQLSGFRDGIQVDNHSATPINVNNSAALTIATGACAPFIAGGGLFEGKIDEFEIWNIALSQSELRDRMCHKITSSDALSSNLVAYYNFDESSGTTAFDGTVNANNGNLANNPTRVTSGAAIGNASSHDYSNTIKTASITQANGESITITSTTGNPDGIQLYSVNEQPNTLDGINTIGNSDTYFGVFQVNGTNPQYTAVYNYLGNPSVTALNEANLQLYNRADNAATSWAPLAAVPNTTAKTITVSGEHTEYLLGKTDIALPLTLLAFTAAKQNNSVQLKWTTRNEINTANFVVERSNGNNNFTAIGQVKASGHMAGAAYQLLDAVPFTTGATQYYRLKMIDNDGRWVYSNIIKINSNTQTIVSVYPNPASAVIIINSHKNQQGIITNAAGQTMCTITLINGSQTLHIAQWPAGLYLLKTQYQVIKIIKNQ